METLSFAASAEFRRWLKKHHDDTDGIWLRFFKKGSGQKTISPAEALDQALCFGWIDGQKKSFDEQSYLIKFTPRRARSIWSKINTGHIERLTLAGSMMPPGKLAVELAKADGRWSTAYESSRTAELPKDFLAALAKNKKAQAFFQTLNKANTYAIIFRLQTARKPETREKRLKLILTMLEEGRTFHPQRSKE